jgi:hypothetical protein
MKILIGQDGTSYSFIAGTKQVKISGLWFAPGVSAVSILNETNRKVLAGFTKRNLNITVSGTDFIIDYSANANAPALIAGDVLTIEISQSGKEAAILGAITAVQTTVDSIAGTSEKIDTVTITLTTLNRTFFATSHGLLKSRGTATQILINDVVANLGSAISPGDKIQVFVSAPQTVTILVSLLSSAISPSSQASYSVYNTAINLVGASYVPFFGLFKLYGNVQSKDSCLLADDNDVILSTATAYYSLKSNGEYLLAVEDSTHVYLNGGSDLIIVTKNGSVFSYVAVGDTIIGIIDKDTYLVLICLLSVKLYQKSGSISNTVATTVPSLGSAVIANNKIFAIGFYGGSAGAVLYIFDEFTLAQLTTIPTTFANTATELHLGSDGYVYASNVGNLYKINTNTYALSALVIGVIGSINHIREYNGYLYLLGNSGIMPVNITTYAATSIVSAVNFYNGVFIGSKFYGFSQTNIYVYNISSSNVWTLSKITAIGFNTNFGAIDTVNSKAIVFYKGVKGYKIYKLSDLE